MSIIIDMEDQKLIVLKELAGNKPTQLSPVQQYIDHHIYAFSYFWFIVWCVTAATMLVKLWYEYKSQRGESHR